MYAIIWILIYICCIYCFIRYFLFYLLFMHIFLCILFGLYFYFFNNHFWFNFIIMGGEAKVNQTIFIYFWNSCSVYQPTNFFLKKNCTTKNKFNDGFLLQSLFWVILTEKYRWLHLFIWCLHFLLSSLNSYPLILLSYNSFIFF